MQSIITSSISVTAVCLRPLRLEAVFVLDVVLLTAIGRQTCLPSFFLPPRVTMFVSPIAPMIPPGRMPELG